MQLQSSGDRSPLSMPAELLEFYRTSTTMTRLDRHRNLLAALPQDPAALAGIVQNLLIYEHFAELFYSVELTTERRQESHLRQVDRILDAVRRRDDRPVQLTRAPAGRAVGICRHFALLLVALLRHQGIAARARVGFAAYFNPGYFEDHWICEYWRAEDCRWCRLDPQIDAIWQDRLQTSFDVLDLPGDQFLTASDAWRACRRGDLSADQFGIEFVKLRGLWFIAGSLVRDLAALNKVEMLAWDIWGAQPREEEELTAAQLALFDDLAELTANPDANFDRLRRRYRDDDRVTVPALVFNALRQKSEPVAAA